MRHCHTCRSVKEQELSAANQQLSCVDTDLDSIGACAAAAGVDSPAEVPSLPGAGRCGAVAAPPITATTGGLDALHLGSHHRQSSQATLDSGPQRAAPGTAAPGAAAGSAGPAADTGDTHARLVQSKEARMHAHFEELQGQYLAKCGTGGAAAAEAHDPLSAAQLRRKRGRDRSRGNAPVANDHQASLQAFTQEIKGTRAPLAVQCAERVSYHTVNHSVMIMTALPTRHMPSVDYRCHRALVCCVRKQPACSRRLAAQRGSAWGACCVSVPPLLLEFGVTRNGVLQMGWP